MKPVKEMTTAELIAEYNQRKGKSIKKFSSRAAGEAQVEAARNASGETTKTGSASPKPSANRSESTAASWHNKAIAAKRKERTHVRVGGEEYRSVGAAFLALKLPMGKMIPFRMEVKKSGRSVFTHDGKSYTFTVAKKEKVAA